MENYKPHAIHCCVRRNVIFLGRWKQQLLLAIFMIIGATHAWAFLPEIETHSSDKNTTDSLPSQLKSTGVLRIIGFGYPHMQLDEAHFDMRNSQHEPILNSAVVNEFRFGYFRKNNHWGWQTTLGYRSEKHEKGYDSVNFMANFTNALIGITGKYYFSNKGYAGLSFGPMVNALLTQNVTIENLQTHTNQAARINPFSLSFFAQLDFGDFKVGPYMSLAPFVSTQLGTKYTLSQSQYTGNLRVNAITVGVNFNILHKAYLEMNPWWMSKKTH